MGVSADAYTDNSEVRHVAILLVWPPLRRHLARRERGEIAGKAAASRDPMAEALIRAV